MAAWLKITEISFLFHSVNYCMIPQIYVGTPWVVLTPRLGTIGVKYHYML